MIILLHINLQGQSKKLTRHNILVPKDSSNRAFELLSQKP